MFKGAEISECGRYRYALWRRWGLGHTKVFVMLNPSTADGKEDDPTIRKCIKFAKRENAGALTVVNLFAHRATNPSELRDTDEFLGPQNSKYLGDAIQYAADLHQPIICAWGASIIAERLGRGFSIMATAFGVDLQCFETTKNGAPKHPLYVQDLKPLIPYGGYDDHR